jgi:OmpA-OmpF porin, OOP family
MCRPSRWYVGLIPLLLLFIAAVGLQLPRIEDDLARRVGGVVADVGLADARIAVAGRDVELSGQTFVANGGRLATGRAESVAGVRRVVAQVQTPPAASVYEFNLVRSPEKAILSGMVPNPEVRNRLLAAVRAIAPNVEDRLSFALGAPAGFEQSALFAIAPLARVTSGSARLSGAQLTIAGQTGDLESYEAALAAIRNPPANLTLAQTEIRPPILSPYAWSAISDGRTITLSGGVPSEAARAAIISSSTQAFPGKTFIDNMKLASGSADGFAGLAQAAITALSRLASGKASMVDGSLTLIGEAADSKSYNAALAAVRALPPGLVLARAEIAPPIVAPYVWSAASDGKSLILEGFAPSDESRGKLLDIARASASGMIVEDRLQIARGAPAEFLEAARSALSALGRLAAGRASFSNGDVSLSGVLRGGQRFESIHPGLANSLPAGFVVARNAVVYPERHPFFFAADKRSDGTVSISGFAPSDSQRAASVDSARRAGSALSGEVDLASGLPPEIDFTESTELGLSVLAKLESGEVRLEEDGLRIRGSGADAVVNAARGLLSRTPSGVRLRLADLVAVSVAESPPQPVVAPQPVPVTPPKRDLTSEEAECQKQLSDRLARETIKFRLSSAEIDRASDGVIADLAKILLGCPAIRMEVAGHTDNTGQPETNKILSFERARSVVSALAAVGVAADRLNPEGYGDERPIASNDTREGRAANRRTEFIVK